jgi:hypothetical protein
LPVDDPGGGAVAIRDKIRANAGHLLRPGEVIQAVIPAQTVSQYFALISYWIIIFANAHRVIVATDQRILVCRSGRFTMTPVGAVEREVPRGTLIGPAHGLWYKCESLGERLYIHRRFHKDIAEADATAAHGRGQGT